MYIASIFSQQDSTQHYAYLDSLMLDFAMQYSFLFCLSQKAADFFAVWID